ncbi:MAG: ferredoxin [Candidatus Babeliales bacterium]|jgi:ferredoxin
MTKKISQVNIMPGCVSCGACTVICPDVFELRGTSHAKPSAHLDKNAALIREAAQTCPVSVIEVIEAND